jgi:hypothetical protein
VDIGHLGPVTLLNKVLVKESGNMKNIKDSSKKYKCLDCNTPFKDHSGEAQCPASGSTDLQLVCEDEYRAMIVDQINQEFNDKSTEAKVAKKAKRARTARSEEISEPLLLFEAEIRYYVTFRYIY